MQTFELYGTAWAVYIVLGICLLGLIYYGTRNSRWQTRYAIISFLAVGAFTPDTITSSDTFAPLVISALLKAEVEGSTAIVNGLTKLLILWGIVFFCSLAVRHFWFANKKNSNQDEVGSVTE
jgi:hypothetical protein